MRVRPSPSQPARRRIRVRGAAPPSQPDLGLSPAGRFFERAAGRALGRREASAAPPITVATSGAGRRRRDPASVERYQHFPFSARVPAIRGARASPSGEVGQRDSDRHPEHRDFDGFGDLGCRSERDLHRDRTACSRASATVKPSLATKSAARAPRGRTAPTDGSPLRRTGASAATRSRRGSVSGDSRTRVRCGRLAEAGGRPAGAVLAAPKHRTAGTPARRPAERHRAAAPGRPAPARSPAPPARPSAAVPVRFR